MTPPLVDLADLLVRGEQKLKELRELVINADSLLSLVWYRHVPADRRDVSLTWDVERTIGELRRTYERGSLSDKGDLLAVVRALHQQIEDAHHALDTIGAPREDGAWILTLTGRCWALSNRWAAEQEVAEAGVRALHQERDELKEQIIGYGQLSVVAMTGDDEEGLLIETVDDAWKAIRAEIDLGLELLNEARAEKEAAEAALTRLREEKATP